MTGEKLQFPVFARYGVTQRLPATAACTLLALLAWPHWRWLAVGAWVMVLWLALPMLMIDLLNAVLRRKWVCGFEKRVHPWDIEGCVRSRSGHFCLHLRYYTAFGKNAVLPAALLEDRESGSLCVVSPSSARIDEIATRLGIAIQYH